MYGIQRTSTDRVLSADVKRSMAFVSRACATWHHGHAKSLYTFTSTFDGGEVAMADASDRNIVKTTAEKTRKTSDALGMTGMFGFCKLQIADLDFAPFTGS